jgi:propanol-preferring alcohol dehydrogenase
MISATMYEYQKPLKIENVTRKPTITNGQQVLVRVGATGLCHSDLHLINGDWKNSIPLQLPIVLGHEIAGYIEEVGDTVPLGLFAKGDMVVVFGGWGCGVCIYCKSGNEQMCNFAKWPGIMTDGGFAEYVLVESYRFLAKVQGENNNNNNTNPQSNETKLRIEEVAPLTDAGLTPYRAIKKVRHLLGPGKTIAVFGIGGLGSYAVQYAKILGQSANIIGLDVNNDKLQLAEMMGADFTINISRYKASFSSSDNGLKEEVLKITKRKGVDVVIDCVGAEETVLNSVKILGKGGTVVLVGLFSNQMNGIPLITSVINEYSIIGSIWGNYNELCEVIELAKNKKIKHKIRRFGLTEINDAISLLKDGHIIGRAVISP